MKFKEFVTELAYLDASGWFENSQSDADLIAKLEEMELDKIFEKAEIVDYALGLDKIHDGKPVTLKGSGGLGFSSAKDFGFVRLMSQLEEATKERTVVKEKLRAIRAWSNRQGFAKSPEEWQESRYELEKILDFPGLDIIRWNLYPDDFPRDPLFPSSGGKD